MKKQKKFKHNIIEKCKLCDKEINTSEEDWAVLIDYSKSKETSIGFYHKICFKNLLEKNVKVIQDKFQDRLGDFVQKVFGKVDLGNYNIK